MAEQPSNDTEHNPPSSSPADLVDDFLGPTGLEPVARHLVNLMAADVLLGLDDSVVTGSVEPRGNAASADGAESTAALTNSSSSPAEGLEQEIEKAIRPLLEAQGTVVPVLNDEVFSAAWVREQADKALRAALSALSVARQRIENLTHSLFAAIERAIKAERERDAEQQRASAAEAQRDALREALRKMRGHTSYTNPDVELLKGLLASIERIADAALLASVPGLTKEEKAEGLLGSTAGKSLDGSAPVVDTEAH